MEEDALERFLARSNIMSGGRGISVIQPGNVVTSTIDTRAFDDYSSEHWAIAEVDCDPNHEWWVDQPSPKLPISYDTAFSVWQKLGFHSIPVMPTEREVILEHPEIRDYAAGHAQLWEKRQEHDDEQDWKSFPRDYS